LGAESDRKLGLARRANIDRVLRSPFRTCNGSRGARYERFGNSVDVSPLCNRGALPRGHWRRDSVDRRFIDPSPARATPVFAGQTGLPCTRCHTAPTGGKALTDFGKEFQANGNKLKKQ